MVLFTIRFSTSGVFHPQSSPSERIHHHRIAGITKTSLNDVQYKMPTTYARGRDRGTWRGKMPRVVTRVLWRLQIAQ